MTETEKKALALVNEVTFDDEPWTLDDVRGGVVFKTLCRAIEQHEAFRQEVSDLVADYVGYVPPDAPCHPIVGLIIPKPVDPFLIEAREVCARVEEERNNPVWATRYRSGQYDEHIGWVKHIRAALAARGLEIREKQP